jgi:hypothetical protein
MSGSRTQELVTIDPLQLLNYAASHKSREMAEFELQTIMQHYFSHSTLNESFSGSGSKVDLRVGDSACTTDGYTKQIYLGDLQDGHAAKHVPVDAEKQSSTSQGRFAGHDMLYVGFEEADPRNPVNFSRQ